MYNLKTLKSFLRLLYLAIWIEQRNASHQDFENFKAFFLAPFSFCVKIFFPPESSTALKSQVKTSTYCSYGESVNFNDFFHPE